MLGAMGLVRRGGFGGSGLVLGGVSNPSYVFTNAEAAAYVARMGTAPSNALKALIDTFIGSLKTGGVYTLLDTLYIFALHNATDAFLNVISSSNTATGVGGPAFTAFQGYTGSGSAYVMLNRASNAAGNYGTNAGHASIWELSNLQADNSTIGPSVNLVPWDTTNHFQGTLNSFSNNNTIPSTSGNGHWIANRSSSSADQFYKNGASIGSDANASNNAPSAASWLVCTGNTSFPAAYQISIVTTGGSLNSTQAAALYNACQVYLHAVGAV